MSTKPTPIDHVRLGSISAAIWSNPTENGPRYGVTIERLYRDPQSGDWRSSQTFGRDDLLVLAKVADRAHTRIHELQAEDRAQSRAAEGAHDGDASQSSPPASTAGGTRPKGRATAKASPAASRGGR